MAQLRKPSDPVAHFPAFPFLLPIGDTHPRPGVSQVESLRFRLSELSGSMEFSPSPLIVYTYQHLRGNTGVNKQGFNRARGGIV